MNEQERLEKLTVQVKAFREQGYVNKWPQDIRQEALFLSHKIGFLKVSKAIKIQVILLQQWMKQSQKESILSTLPHQKKDELQITRFVARPQEIPFEGKIKAIVTVLKGEVELKFFCKATLLEFAQRVFS